MAGIYAELGGQSGANFVAQRRWKSLDGGLEKAKRDHALRSRSVQAAAFHVENLILVDGSNGSAVIRLHVICGDLQRGNRVNMRRRGKQERVVAKASVATLRVRRNANVAKKTSLPALRGGRFH